jgi:TonB family protein
MRPLQLLCPIILLLLIYPNDSEAQQDMQEPLAAVEAYRKNAEQGNSDAQYRLALAYAQGQGVTRDYAKALEWFRKAAEQDHVNAQFTLGQMYSSGEGIPQDHAEAAKWFSKAAEQGNPGAQVSLGLIYIQGIGVPKDYVEAAKWFRKSAEQGNHRAQSILGSMHAEGLGVTKDYIEAYMWLTLSVTGSISTQNPFFQKATELRDSYRKKLTPQQIEEAEKLAGEWKLRHRRTPMAVGGIVQESRLIRKIEPVYPELAKRSRVMGNVILVVTVDEEGNVTDTRVSSGHPLLSEAAVTAVKQWKYAPTYINGEPVPVIANVTVSFSLSLR